MPPWHASTTEGGPFRDARVLSDAEIATLAAWAKAGRSRRRPQGRPARPRSSTPAGRSASPTSSSRMPEPYELGGRGADEHRVFVIPTGPDRRANGSPRSTSSRATPRSSTTSSAPSTSRARRGSSTRPTRGRATRSSAGSASSPDGFMSGWSPGRRPRPRPRGSAATCPAGSDFILQVHYHKSGKPETDATQVGALLRQEADRQGAEGPT